MSPAVPAVTLEGDDDMSITPSGPPPNDSTQYEVSPTPKWIPLLLVVAFLGIGVALYLGNSARTDLQNSLAASNAKSDVLSKELDQTNARVAELRGQLDVTSQKLGLTQDELARARGLAQTIQKQQEESDAKIGAQLGQVQQVQQDTNAKIGAVSTDLTGAKTDIASTRKDLEDTKSKLTSTVGDLGVQSGLIARNKEEVDALKRLNERNIYDFTLTKSKTPQHVGPIQLTLRSTDAKKFRFTMTVVADDKAIEKRDRNVDEPMQFYIRGVRAPYEIVVFDVTKDHATGYLSTPKDAGTPAAAAAPGAKAQ
jgi:hypothetical protein